MKESNNLCHHPNQYPYDPQTGKKNKPCKTLVCDFGENKICPKCGYGHGAYPCKCNIKAILKDGA